MVCRGRQELLSISPSHLPLRWPWPENYLEHSRLFRVGGTHHIPKTRG